MSQPGVIYRMDFLNAESFTIRVDIYPTDTLIPDGDVPVIIPLVGSGSPVVISASNNDEDKFTQIRSKSAKITFRSDSGAGIDSSTFSQGADNLWRVNIYLQDTPQLIFTGFLMMADNQQPFQPDPQYVTLTATDHLAALKELPLTDFSGINPVGKFRVADFLAYCLIKTGLDLSFFVVNNLRAGGGQFTYSVTFNGGTDIISGFTDTRQFYVGQNLTITGTSSNNVSGVVSVVTPTSITIVAALTTEFAPAAIITDDISTFHWYDAVYLDAKTFEKSIGLSVSCYEVLEKILGEDCYITQWHGVWWIMRDDETEDNPTYVAEFTSAGVYVSTAVDTIEKSIGAIHDYKFANADTLLRFVRPHGFIKETFNYTVPLEVPCNVDFSRGTFVSPISTPYSLKYTIECWTKRRGLPGAYNTPITIEAYINKILNTTLYEIERFIYITPQTGHSGFSSTDDEYIESEAIPVLINDKFSASIDWKLANDIASSSGGFKFMRFVLHGDDGSWWILGWNSFFDDTSGPKWYNTSGWASNSAAGERNIVWGDQDETVWATWSNEAPPCPVSGNLYIWLNQIYQSTTPGLNTTIYYDNLSFEYLPYINGSYQKYSGQYSKVTRTEDGYFANRDKEVFISDAPAKIYKGAMFLFLNSAYILVPSWFSSAPFISGYPPSPDYLHPYGYIQAFSVWNQYKGYNTVSPIRGKGINIFQGSVKGLTDSWPDLLHKIFLTDSNPQTDNRIFMLISLQQDWKRCVWTATLVEVYNQVIFKSYGDPFEFKYIAQ